MPLSALLVLATGFVAVVARILLIARDSVRHHSVSHQLASPAQPRLMHRQKLLHRRRKAEERLRAAQREIALHRRLDRIVAGADLNRRDGLAAIPRLLRGDPPTTSSR